MRGCPCLCTIWQNNDPGDAALSGISWIAEPHVGCSVELNSGCTNPSRCYYPTSWDIHFGRWDRFLSEALSNIFGAKTTDVSCRLSKNFFEDWHATVLSQISDDFSSTCSWLSSRSTRDFAAANVYTAASKVHNGFVGRLLYKLSSNITRLSESCLTMWEEKYAVNV